MFRPPSLPLRPSGAPVSSLKFSVSHQHATQHRLCIALVWSALYGAVWSLPLLFRCRLIEPDSRCGTERKREIESTLRSHRCKLLESAESGKLAGKKTRLPFIAHKQGPESRSVSISTASLFSASDISTIESVAYI